MAIDPVCKMEVDPETAMAKLEHGGTLYYFCSDSCRQSFEDNPEEYLRDEPSSGHSHQHD